jgi:nucleoside-diphosphate-sugar epimerase
LKILITGAGLDLSTELAHSLKDRHQVRLTDRSSVSTELEFVRSDLDHGRGTGDLVRGMDAVIHAGRPVPGNGPADQVDYHTRCTYNLLYAASEENVPLLVYLSSLALMERYGEDLKVTEHWRPLPTTDPEVLCCHLGELVCREFAREGRIAVACLRLGDPVLGGQAPGSSSSLLLEDALQAVEAALDLDTWSKVRDGEPSLPPASADWGLFHVQSALPGARFSIRSARRLLGYKPAGEGGRTS